MDFSDFLYGFLKVATCISCPLPYKTKLKCEQDFKACWSFYFELKVLNESKYSMPWVRCAFGNLYISNHDIRDGQVTVCCYCNTMISVVVLCCWQANEEASQCIVLSVVMFCKHSSDGGLSKDGKQPDAYFFSRRDIKGIFQYILYWIQQSMNFWFLAWM